MTTTIRKMIAGNPTIDDATQLYTEANVSAFRFLLNQRQFPLAPAAKVEAKPKTRRSRINAPRPEGWAPVKSPGADAHEQAERQRVASVVAKMQKKNKQRAIDTEYERVYAHGFPTTRGTKPKPSERRPEAANVIWKTYVGDMQLVLAAKQVEVKATVETTAGAQSITRTETRWYVCQAEQQTVSLATDDQLHAANVKYFVRTSKEDPSKLLGEPMVYKSEKGWKVLEPSGSYLGPFTSEDEAEDTMRKWASELRVEASFHDDAGHEEWTRDSQ